MIKKNIKAQSLAVNKKYEILTENGWESFKGIVKSSGNFECIVLKLENDITIVSTLDHKFYLSNGQEVIAENINVGDYLKTANGVCKVLDMDSAWSKNVYDIFGVKSNKFLIDGDVITHNCDEYAFLSNHIQDKFWDSVYPILSTGGACIITSTPNGDTNLFAKMWRQALLGTNEFVPTHVKWNDPPGRDEQFKKTQKAVLGERKWLQEYECHFLSSEKTLVDSLTTTALQERIDRNEFPEIFEFMDIKFRRRIDKLKTYIVSVDPATGVLEDNTCIQVFEFPSMFQVAEFADNTSNPNKIYETLKKLLLFLQKFTSNIYFSVENNGVGIALLALYSADENSPEYANLLSESKTGEKLGICTTGKSKLSTCLRLKEFIENGHMTITSPELVTELKNYVRSAGSYAGNIGATDDRVSACLILVRIIELMADFDPSAYDKLYSINISNETVELTEDEYDEYSVPLPFYIS